MASAESLGLDEKAVIALAEKNLPMTRKFWELNGVTVAEAYIQCMMFIEMCTMMVTEDRASEKPLS